MKWYGQMKERLKSGRVQNKTAKRNNHDKNCAFWWIYLESVQKACRNLNALTTVCKTMFLERRRTFMKAFIETQFGYYPLIWMFCERNSNNRINHLHEQALRVVYNNN